jgi:hypothetical protein
MEQASTFRVYYWDQVPPMTQDGKIDFERIHKQSLNYSESEKVAASLEIGKSDYPSAVFLIINNDIEYLAKYAKAAVKIKRFVVVGSRIYELAVMGPGLRGASPEATYFFQSFQPMQY